jgi:type I restriction enzyme S subunit
VTGAKRLRVGDVLQLERRGVHVNVSAEYEEIGVRSFGRGIFHKEPVGGASLGAKRVFRIEPGDLVLSNVFAWEGAIAVASPTERGKIGSHRFMTFVARDGRIDTSWAAWYFLSEPGLELIQKASPGSAGRNKTLAVKRFEELMIPVPPIDDQREQAAYLDRISDQARAASTVLAEHGSDAVVTALPPLVDELVGRFASDRASVGDLVDLVSDTVHPGDFTGDVESFVGLQHIERHTGRRVGADELDSMKGRKFRFQPGDVVYGYLRPYLNKVWAADRHGLCSVDQYVLRPKPTTNPELLAHILRGQAVLDRAIDLTHSLQLPRLRSGLLVSLDVPVVADDDAADLVKRLDALRDRVIAIAACRDRQARAAGALTPAALNQVFGSR